MPKMHKDESHEAEDRPSVCKDKARSNAKISPKRSRPCRPNSSRKKPCKKCKTKASLVKVAEKPLPRLRGGPEGSEWVAAWPKKTK